MTSRRVLPPSSLLAPTARADANDRYMMPQVIAKPTALHHGRNEIIHARRRPSAERDDAARQREQILHPMIHLPDEQVLLLLGAAPLADVRAIVEAPMMRPE